MPAACHAESFHDGTLLTQDPIGLAGGVNLYAYAGNNPVAFSDPFGLCPPEDTDFGPHCPGFFTTLLTGVGAILGGAAGGAGGGTGGLVVCSSTGPVALACGATGMVAGAAVGATKGAAEGALIGAGLDAVADGLFALFAKSHSVAQTTVGQQTVMVHWEESTSRTPGNVHVQGKGKGGNWKEYINSLEDLKNLPKEIRDNHTIRNGVEKAIDMLQRFKDSQ